MPIALAVHGGAWNIPDEAVELSAAGVHEALESGWHALRKGASSLDVVERVVRILEDNPSFDAGRGSRLNSEGNVEMDASIMDGSRLMAGAVAAIQNVRHPVSLARRVMQSTPHVMLVGQGAQKFAMEAGAEHCKTVDLLVGAEKERYLRVQAGETELVEREFDPEGGSGPMGTVGAVALDGNGRVAAATSTGGTQHKAPGRVGDTPIIGAGTYADGEWGAASCTGWGEGIMRVLLGKSAIDRLAQGKPVDEAARECLLALDRVKAKGGLILIDRNGRAVAAFNTPRMARGIADEQNGLRVAVDPRSPAP